MKKDRSDVIAMLRASHIDVPYDLYDAPATPKHGETNEKKDKDSEKVRTKHE